MNSSSINLSEAQSINLVFLKKKFRNRGQVITFFKEQGNE